MPSFFRFVGLSAAVAGVMLAAAAGSAAGPDDGFTLQDPRTGQSVKVQLGAPAVHLVFFAVWCPPCRSELRQLSELAARWEERGYRLVLVAVQSRQTADRLVRFAQENELPGELLFDADGSLESALKTEGLPTHVVFDSNGHEVARSGALTDDVRATIESLLAPERHGGGESR
jgi:peroxiredoxin